MKKNVFAIVLLSVFVLCSCSNDDEIGGGESNLAPIQSPEVMKMQSTAEIIASIVSSNPEVVQEVKIGVDNSLNYGMDEELRFIDVLNPDQSKTLRSTSSSSILGDILRKELRENFVNQRPTLKSSMPEDLESFLSNENIQIYWPYSENWDGKELPVITFDPHNNSKSNKGFKYVSSSEGKLQIEEVIIDEAFAKSHPVWIINQNNVDYEDLPNFIAGEVVKNNVTYITKAILSNGVEKPQYISGMRATAANPYYVFDVEIGCVVVSRQYDDFFNGGSEFAFKIATPKLLPSFGSMIDSITGRNSYARFVVSRSQISKKKSLFPHILMISDMRPEYDNFGFLLYEEDQGSQGPYKEIKLSAFGFTAQFPITMGSGDDFIYYNEYGNRAWLTGPGNLINGEWPKFKMHGIQNNIVWNFQVNVYQCDACASIR